MNQRKLNLKNLKEILFPLAKKYDMNLKCYEIPSTQQITKPLVVFEFFDNKNAKFSAIIPTNIILEEDLELALIIKSENKLSLIYTYKELKKQIYKISGGKL